MTRKKSTLHGWAENSVSWVRDALEDHLSEDSELSIQVAAHHRGTVILDLWGGPHLHSDSMLVPYSVTKSTIGFTIALLVERGQLHLDERVATYWPEFAAAGKQDITVRMLLSHQAGLPQARPALSTAELLSHHTGAARLAQTHPFWHPGSGFGYHATTIGNLADELVFRATGQTLHKVFEEEIRHPYGLEFHLGLPRALDGHRTPLEAMARPSSADQRPGWSPYLSTITASAEPGFDYGNDERSWRFGHPAGSGTASARGISGLFAAAVTGLGDQPALLSANTVAMIGQQQVRGYDLVLGQENRSHAIVFQKPSPQLNWGGPHSFGHDGAFGCLGCVDPDTGITFGYTVSRGPWPGGADPRAIDIAARLNRQFGELLGPQAPIG